MMWLLIHRIPGDLVVRHCNAARKHFGADGMMQERALFQGTFYGQWIFMSFT